jgi:hypothetical protein
VDHFSLPSREAKQVTTGNRPQGPQNQLGLEKAAGLASRSRGAPAACQGHSWACRGVGRQFGGLPVAAAPCDCHFGSYWGVCIKTFLG